MQDLKKCDREGCNAVVTDCNKKTSQLKKYCSNQCRYKDHSEKMKKHPRIEDAPLCAYYLCKNLTTKKTTGKWKKFCCRECQNKQIAYENSDFFNTLPPKCKNTVCENHVPKGRYGHWKLYCSRKCAGQHNSIKSRKKSSQTCLERYGVTNPSLSKTIIDNIQEVKRKNYSPFTSSHLSHLSVDSIEKLTDKTWLETQNKVKPLYKIAEEIGISPSSLGVRFKKFGLVPQSISVNQSQFELDVKNYIESLGVDVVCKDRTVLKPKEIDLYVPSLNLAIECNGAFWHSELQGKGQYYHINKTKLAHEKNINLIHINDFEWKYKNDIIKSIILSKLNSLDRIYARNCIIEVPTKQEERYFLEKNHIQGFVGSNICYGLYLNDELVSIMSFGKSRFEDNKIELLRFSNKLWHTVIGAASKLFKHFLSNNSVTEIISYSHKDKFTGNMYKKLGFEYSHTTNPSYYYTKDYNKFENRIKYQKHKLSKLLPVFDSNLTEWQNMQNNGYDRIWDCGNDVWVWKNKNDK